MDVFNVSITLWEITCSPFSLFSSMLEFISFSSDWSTIFNSCVSSNSDSGSGCASDFCSGSGSGSGSFVTASRGGASSIYK